MTRGYAAVGLYRPKTSHNVGSALRAVGCYEAAFLAIEGQRYRKACTDTMAAYRHRPLFHVPDLHSAIPFDCVPVAVELCKDARSLFTYTHPERAFYIFGPEDGSVPTKVLEWCRDKVYIPMDRCSNLACTVNVVLYDRAMKASRT